MKKILFELVVAPSAIALATGLLVIVLAPIAISQALSHPDVPDM